MMAPTDLARMVPGFDFLQGLLKNAGGALPAMGQWIAPTLDPKELDKRIQELKTVQFWLEQNARLLATTVQAMEVQRMTLSTLQTMNLPLADLGNALQLKWPLAGAADPAPAAFASPSPAPAAAAPAASTTAPAAPEPAAAATAPAPRTTARGKADGGQAPATGAVDPLQWWGALTQQFTQLATQALQGSAGDGAGGGTKPPAGARPAGADAAPARAGGTSGRGGDAASERGSAGGTTAKRRAPAVRSRSR